MVKWSPVRGLALFLLLSILFLSCGSMMTRNKFYAPITEDIKNQNFQAAVAKIDRAREDGKFGKKDRLLYYLDAGFANHYAANYDTSISKLTQAEQAASELFTKSISRAATSLALNDNVLEYSGEDYEVLYTNLFNALNFLAKDDFDGAFVEIRRANEKLDLLEMKYAGAVEKYKQSPEDDTLNVNQELPYEIEKVRFNNDAFARYLSMHMYAADSKYDDARIDYEMLVDAFETQPHIYDFDRPQVEYAPDSGVILSFVAMAGLAPIKEPVNLRIRTDKTLGLIQVLYTDGPNKDSEYAHLPFSVKADYYFKFSLPVLTQRPSMISRIRVYADDGYLGELQLIEDVSKVAEETFKAKKSLIYFRTIARAVVKGLATHLAKKKIDKKNEGPGGWLMKAAVDVATDISENADLRCSYLLPGRIYVGDFEIEPGVYDLRVDFIDFDGRVISSQTTNDYEVKKSGWNMLETFSLD
jgi:hypothetical protein